MTNIPSESDGRTVNNTMRHQYRTEGEKAAMLRIHFLHRDRRLACRKAAEASIAKTKIEEAVLWAVKGLTA